MRIGDVLLNAGLVTERQLEQALRAQVMWGGRLGTNLVDLGHLQLDELSRALGIKYDLPAALEGHFARADRELQEMLPAELAEMYECIPLVRAGKRVVIAAAAPLDDKAVALVAGQLDVNRHMIVQSIAAEMRIHFQLEQIYSIPRPQRFMRSRGTTEQSQLFRVPEQAVVAREPRRLEPVELKPAVALDVPLAEPLAKLTGADRRAYLQTLADTLASGEAAAPARTAKPPAGRPLAIGSAKLPKIDLAVIADSLPEALADLELARDREELARRLIGTVARFVPESRSALLLMIRGDAAVSWTSFSRSGEELPALAVPLGHPGLVSAVTKRRSTCRGASGDLQPVDYLLLEWLGVQFGDLVVAPISLGENVIGTVVLATEQRAGLAGLEAITAAASSAFTRLMANAASN